MDTPFLNEALRRKERPRSAERLYVKFVEGALIDDGTSLFWDDGKRYEIDEQEAVALVRAKTLPYRELMFGIHINVTGNLISGGQWWHEASLDDIVNTCDLFLGQEKPSDPGDTEYFYLARESGDAEHLKKNFLNGVEFAGGIKEDFAQWALDRWEGDSDIWWATCSDYTNGGELSSRQFFNFLKELPLALSQTGGDGADFHSESRNLIANMYVKPWLRVDGEYHELSAEQHARFDRFFYDPYLV